MSNKRELSRELREVIVWLERQPGVTSVVQGRYTRSRHHHKPGFTRVSISDDKSVHLRAYDKTGVKDLFVHAKPSQLRDRWIAAVTTGQVADGNGSSAQRHDVAGAVRAAIAAGTAPSTVPTPAVNLLNASAGQVFMVTPELAAQWLEHNTRNRRLRQSVVNKYAADIKAGRWMLTGDCIAFDKNGAIVNGQHRLWAVLEAGVAVPMTVMFNLEPGVVAVLDDHLKRNMADVAGIRKPGTSISTLHAAIANMLLQTSILAHAVDRRQALERITRQAQLDSMDRHWDAIEFALRECFRSARIRGISVAAVLTPVARAFYTQDRERLRKFGQVMLSGMAERATEDQPAILLRNFLMRSTTGSVRAVSDVIYRKTERALAAFLEGNRLATLYEASTELFPLPEEKPSRRGGER